MRVSLFLALTGALLGQSPAPPRIGLRSYEFPHPANKLRLWLPAAYEPDSKVSRKYERKPTVTDPDVVTLRMSLHPVKLAETPAVPLEPDLMMVDPSLVNLKFTGTVGVWRGKPVASARYEGYVQGGLGVYGRMAWLPLEQGTVVINLYSEPSWTATMNQDWDVILANIEGPISELTLRERAPNRWLAGKVLSTLGCLAALAGFVIILARMNEAIGGAVVYAGLLLPVIPVGYAFLHLHDCRRGLLILFSGGALVGVAILVEH